MQQTFQQNIGLIIFTGMAIAIAFLCIWLRVRGGHIEKMDSVCELLANFYAGKKRMEDLVSALNFDSSFVTPTAETAPLLCQQVFLGLLERHELTLEPRENLDCFRCAQWKRVGNLLCYWWTATLSGVSLEDSITQVQRLRNSIAGLNSSNCRTVLLAYVSFVEGVLLLQSHEKNPRNEKQDALTRAFGIACTLPSLQTRSMDYAVGARKFVEAEIPEKLKVTA